MIFFTVSQKLHYFNSVTIINSNLKILTSSLLIIKHLRISWLTVVCPGKWMKTDYSECLKSSIKILRSQLGLNIQCWLIYKMRFSERFDVAASRSVDIFLLYQPCRHNGLHWINTNSLGRACGLLTNWFHIIIVANNGTEMISSKLFIRFIFRVILRFFLTT